MQPVFCTNSGNNPSANPGSNHCASANYNGNSDTGSNHCASANHDGNSDTGCYHCANNQCANYGSSYGTTGNSLQVLQVRRYRQRWFWVQLH
jgi:hypothetical protein